MRGYLTPNSIPTDTICRVLFIPNNQEFIANVTGAIEELTFPENWTAYGMLTPDQAALALVDMFDGFCFNQGTCRMIGEIIEFAGASNPNPTKWLECDGASLLRATYPDLFTTIGTLYGNVDGTHFNLPDFRGRVRVGSGTGTGLSPRAVGDQFGEETHQLTVSELASHNHALQEYPLTGTSVPPPLDGVDALPHLINATGFTGGDVPHNNLQPSLVSLVLIVALP